MPASTTSRVLLAAVVTFSTLTLGGCSSIINSQMSKLADSLGETITDNDDPATVAEALPTFLIISESLAKSNPDSVDLNLSVGQLYSSYAGTFVTDEQRQKQLARKGFRYAQIGACQDDSRLCDIEKQDFNLLAQEEWQADSIATLYGLASSWVGKIQTNSSDWNEVAQLPKVKLLLEQVVAIDESYENGNGHLYLGALATLVPPSLGGKPEVGRNHFERAIEISEGKNLMAKVEFARRYARMMFDQELHHQLLTEVLEAETDVPGLTLANTLAQQQAKALLADEADYF